MSFSSFFIEKDRVTGFELSVSRSWNAIYFSIIAMPKKFHFTILAIQNFVQSTKKRVNSIYIVSWL